ncbi:MAG: hypothetical protein H8D80_00480 [Proteobacteria bacterium]|nr:hypothetical protein [Pseudomonadota bacterium]
MKPKKPKSKDTTHYVDNALFFEEMKKWKYTVNEAEDLAEPKPPVTDYIGECFLKIAEHLSYRPNFINYPFREEMVGDGVENCLMYCSNFDPDKSKNPFSYFTQIIYYAFLRRIQKEKKQNYIKYKCFELMDDNGVISDVLKITINTDLENSKNPIAEYFKLNENDIKKFEPKRKKKTKKKTTKNLDEVLQDDIKSEDSTEKL